MYGFLSIPIWYVQHVVSCCCKKPLIKAKVSNQYWNQWLSCERNKINKSEWTRALVVTLQGYSTFTWKNNCTKSRATKLLWITNKPSGAVKMQSQHLSTLWQLKNVNKFRWAAQGSPLRRLPLCIPELYGAIWHTALQLNSWHLGQSVITYI